MVLFFEWTSTQSILQELEVVAPTSSSINFIKFISSETRQQGSAIDIEQFSTVR